MIVTANGCVRSAEEDADILSHCGPAVHHVLTEEMPKFMAWLQLPHPEIDKAYRESVMSPYTGFNFFMEPEAE